MVTDLDIGEGSVKVGSMICFDREFPESARIWLLSRPVIIPRDNLTATDVPCLECDQCGEKYYTDEVAEKLEKMNSEGICRYSFS